MYTSCVICTSSTTGWITSKLYEGTSKIFRTGAAIYTAVVEREALVDGRTTMSTESVCQVARSWVDVGSFHTRLFGVVYFAIASVREFLDTPSHFRNAFRVQPYSCDSRT
jgi:hypothetical protein